MRIPVISENKRAKNTYKPLGFYHHNMSHKFKCRLNFVYSFFGLPALMMHEIAHYFTGFLVGYHYDLKQSGIERDDCWRLGYCLWEKDHKRKLWKTMLASLAPLYLLITVAVLAIFHKFFLYLLIYQLLAFRFSLPGSEDWRKIRYHKLYKKHLDNIEVMNRFFSLKGLFKDEEDPFAEFILLSTTESNPPTK